MSIKAPKPTQAFWCSNILEEDEEFFEVLPKGQLNASLIVAARILSCDSEEFSAIQHCDLTGI